MPDLEGIVSPRIIFLGALGYDLASDGLSGHLPLLQYHHTPNTSQYTATRGGDKLIEFSWKNFSSKIFFDFEIVFAFRPVFEMRCAKMRRYVCDRDFIFLSSAAAEVVEENLGF